MAVFFHPQAEGEFREAIIWYEHQRIGLGSEFFLCIDEAIERILRNPASFPIIHNNMRRALVKRFPFAIFFEIEKSDIRILAYSIPAGIQRVYASEHSFSVNWPG